jgi:hypothetical protein
MRISFLPKRPCKEEWASRRAEATRRVSRGSPTAMAFYLSCLGTHRTHFASALLRQQPERACRQTLQSPRSSSSKKTRRMGCTSRHAKGRGVCGLFAGVVVAVCGRGLERGDGVGTHLEQVSKDISHVGERSTPGGGGRVGRRACECVRSRSVASPQQRLAALPRRGRLAGHMLRDVCTSAEMRGGGVGKSAKCCRKSWGEKCVG